MALLYKKALVIGATSGIGEALAAKLLEAGSAVIVTGRRQDRLDAFLAKHGNEHATATQLDITDLRALSPFASRITRDHPDLDAIILNSGVQRAFNFAFPDKVDLNSFQQELTTNYTSHVAIVTAFLPHLQKLAKDGRTTHLVFMSASLGLVPGLVRTPGYNASKAALHSWIITVRQQLKDNGDDIRVVEVFPPAVQTELHDEKHQPDMKNGGEIGMPLDQFIEQTYAKLEKGDEEFAVGHAQEWLDSGFEAERRSLFGKQQVAMKANLAKYLQ
jgi:short-subunit dehydrogenase involved in D-alanine esterification of teichoic acids